MLLILKPRSRGQRGQTQLISNLNTDSNNKEKKKQFMFCYGLAVNKLVVFLHHTIMTCIRGTQEFHTFGILPFNL